jgi:hypothetical protein
MAALGQLKSPLVQVLMHGDKEVERAQRIADPFQGVVVYY